MHADTLANVHQVFTEMAFTRVEDIMADKQMHTFRKLRNLHKACADDKCNGGGHWWQW
jgi:hypothetical protein